MECTHFAAEKKTRDTIESVSEEDRWIVPPTFIRRIAHDNGS